jgi:Alg9-like mannosyltransferase family
MSTSSSDLSVASAKVNGDIKSSKGRQSRRRQAVARVAHSASTQDILLFLVAFRILNALTIRTFFQPDEYFQSLEPAWRMVFGEESGAWITWVSPSRTRLMLELQSANNLQGMEERASICHTPCYLRGSLLLRQSCCRSPSIGSRNSRGILSRSTENLTSNLRSTGRLLHLAVSKESLRTRKLSVMGSTCIDGP